MKQPRQQPSIQSDFSTLSSHLNKSALSPINYISYIPVQEDSKKHECKCIRDITITGASKRRSSNCEAANPLAHAKTITAEYTIGFQHTHLHSARRRLHNPNKMRSRRIRHSNQSNDVGHGIEITSQHKCQDRIIIKRRAENGMGPSKTFQGIYHQIHSHPPMHDSNIPMAQTGQLLPTLWQAFVSTAIVDRMHRQ